MPDSSHPPFELLTEYVRGNFPDEQVEMLLLHLETCENCLEKVDQLWSENPVVPGLFDSLKDSTSKRLEQKTLHRMHRSQLAGNLVWLGTFGLLGVFLVFLKPFLRLFSGAEIEK